MECQNTEVQKARAGMGSVEVGDPPLLHGFWEEHSGKSFGQKPAFWWVRKKSLLLSWTIKGLEIQP